MSGCQSTTESFNAAFLASPPIIAEEIRDYSWRTPMWLSNLWELKEWTATDTSMQQIVFKGSNPEIERGFARWKQLVTSSGCEPCVNDCSYNFTTFANYGMNRRMVSLMRREFKTDTFCVNTIRSSYEYAKTFSMLIQNIQQQVATFKEINIGQNYLTGIAIKLLIDGSGIKGNSANPYEYRPLGTATLSKLNFRITTKLYEALRRRTEIEPFMIQDGKAIYAISASDELMDAMYIDDATARADLRFSSAADALLTKYNFMTSIRGQFINAPIMYPRRFTATASAWTEVLPYINGLPAEIGTFSDINPAWEDAPYEEVLFYGQKPFTVWYRSPISTVGEGTSFGPAPTFLNTWLWVNPQTTCDVFRREGFYASEIEIALGAQWSQVYGVMFPRPNMGLIASYFPASTCPPTPVDCDNTVPAIITCPCPLVLSATASPFTDGLYTIAFGVPIDAEVNDSISIGIGTGGYLTGTVAAITTDGKTLNIQFAAGTAITNCNGFTAVFCDNTLGCSSIVTTACDCRSGETGDFKVILANPIKAVTAGQIVYGYMGDGTTQHFDVVSADMVTNTWVLEYSAGYGPTDDPEGEGTTGLNTDIVCDRNGMFRICVPPATDATCPSCDQGPVITQCAS